MDLRRYISIFLVFYLFLLQVEIAFGHTHHADCEKDTAYKGIVVLADEDVACIACFATTLTPSFRPSEAFFLEPVYVTLANSPGFVTKAREYSARQENLSDRAPPVSASVFC